MRNPVARHTRVGRRADWHELFYCCLSLNSQRISHHNKHASGCLSSGACREVTVHTVAALNFGTLYCTGT